MNSPEAAKDAGLGGGVVIVTGGSRGIGRAIVERLAAAGMDVNFTYRGNAAAANEVIAANPGGKITAAAVDVRDSAACAVFVEQVADRAGRIDLLVNNAGVVRDNPLTALEDEDVRVVLETNVVGVFNMARAVAPYLISQRRGKIINLSSVSGEKGGRGQTNYAASKGAINAFTRSLAVELAPRGITVNAVAPGVIETEMSRPVRELAGEQILSRILLRRIGRPEEVAHAVWFLASSYADYITGQILHVDGGFKME
ncbi:MAG: 3-oxoacyl-ACP reductase FabG [Verrucomicrobiota bacterium]|nr:3-oxoacyl-ACP reductase FabG [Verrucomicrobiota bacterium]MCC6822044.1 3-oxoacyl-ACP reductase FabG [Limisphaerales bacterium]